MYTQSLVDCVEYPSRLPSIYCYCFIMHSTVIIGIACRCVVFLSTALTHQYCSCYSLCIVVNKGGFQFGMFSQRRLSMSCLKTDDKMKFIFLRFHTDLLQIQNIYERDKEDPHTGRNMPMFSGRIAWARQLYQKIEQPMLLFKEHKWLFRWGSSSYLRLCTMY